MANYYRLFSVTLALNTAEEREWCKEKYKELSGKEEEDGGPAADFRGSLDDEGFWIRDNGESGNVEQVADFVQEFLRKFDPDGTWSLEWADTCSKPRADGFGGGALIVTSQNIKFMTTSEWVREQTRLLPSNTKAEKSTRNG